MELYKYFKKQNAWGIDVKNCGYQHTNAGEPYPPEGHPEQYYFTWEAGRRLPEFQISYITSGSGIFESETIPLRKVNTGDILLIYENEWHRYKPLDEIGWETYWVGFDGPYFRQYILRDLFPKKGCLIRTIGYQDVIIMSFEQILLMSKRNFPHLNIILSGSVLNLLSIVISLDDDVKPNQHKDEIVEQTYFLLRKHLSQSVDFKLLAKQFGMSYSGYRKLFKSKTGLALNQFIIKERLLLAQRLLRNTHLSLNEISAKCGFESLYYFSRLYKSKLGYAPSRERKMIHPDQVDW
jgi:AraC-like DNA-binding protein